MKNYETIQLNVKVTDSTADQIKRLAASNHITVAEQLRQFIEKGLNVNSYEQQIDLIASIIRQEILALPSAGEMVVQMERSLLASIEKQASRIEKMQMKIGKVSAAGYFLLIKVLLNMMGKNDPMEFAAMVEQAGQLGVEFMKQKNSTVNEILQDGIYACRTADEQLS